MIQLRLTISLRKFLIVVLIILIGMIFALAYLYYVLSKPPGRQTYRTSDLRPIFSIYGKSTKVEDLLKRPNDVAFDADGRIFIADSENGRILVFDRGGRFIRQIGRKGAGEGEFQVPMGVAVSADGTVYVTDKILSKVAVFGPDGQARGDIPVAHPMKPFVTDDRLYVTTAKDIQVFSIDGRKLTTLGKKGKGKGDLDYPFGIAVEGSTIYAADIMNLRVQAFKTNGEVVWVKGKPAKDVYGKNRTFGLPSGIALGEDGYLYVADSFYHQIAILDREGGILARVGRQGKGEGEFNYPVGIASRGDGVFAVADKYNDRVQVVGITVRERTRRIPR